MLRAHQKEVAARRIRKCLEEIDKVKAKHFRCQEEAARLADGNGTDSGPSTAAATACGGGGGGGGWALKTAPDEAAAGGLGGGAIGGMLLIH